MVTHNPNRQIPARKHRRIPSNFREYERYRAYLYWKSQREFWIMPDLSGTIRLSEYDAEIFRQFLRNPPPLVFLSQEPTDVEYIKSKCGPSGKLGKSGRRSPKKNFLAMDYLGYFRTKSFP